MSCHLKCSLRRKLSGGRGSRGGGFRDSDMVHVDQYKLSLCRERDEINVVKDDATVTSFVHDTGLQPEFETENKMDEKAISEEEFDCSSVTESSEGKRKIAELDEKARRLKAQFAEENRLAIESMNKIVEEIKQSQEREDTITNEMEEMRRRQDEIKDDLKRLDEMGQRRELEDKKWRKKMDKKKEKVARRLEKVRADRRKYQQETEDENDTTGKQDQPDKNSTESQECKRAAKGTESVKNEDISNKVLYEPHEIKEYKSVKELEKKRKELRRLERLQKKSIKREKLERREQKKIEKEKRKVARKLEKLTAKNLIVSEETPETSNCVNQPMEASNAAAKEDPEEPQKVNESKNELDTTCDVDKKQDASPEQSDYHHAEVGVSNTTAKEGSEEPQKESEIEQQLDATCDVDEIKQDVSNKKSDKYQGGQGSSCLNASPEESDYHHAEVGVSNTTAREDSEDPQKENEIEQQCDATLDIDEIKREISHKEFGQHLKEEGPSFHIQDVHSCAAKEVALGNCPLQTFEYVMEKKPDSDSNIFRSEVPEVDADVGGQRSSRIEKGNGVESKSDGSVEVELEKSLSGELPRVQSNASFRSDEKQKHFFCDNQRDELEASYDVEIEWVENDDSLKAASVELYSILEDLDFQPKDNVQAISVPELPRTPADVEIINQTEVKAESDKGIESNTDVSVQEGVEEEPYSDFAKEYTKDSDYLDEERKCVVENKQIEEKVLADVEIECLEKDDTLEELLSIEEELDIEPESNSQSKGEPQERYFLPDDYAPVSSSTGCEGPFPQEEEECAKDDRVTMSHIHYDPSSDRRTLQIMDVYSSGKEDSRDSDKPNAKPMNPPGNVINIDTLVSASESIDEVLDYSENAEDLVQPVRSHRGKTVMKYSKSNDDEATEYCVAEEPGDKDETGSKSEGIYSYGDDKPDLIRGSSPVTNQPSPLTRKTSGRLTPFGLQQLYRSPDPILEDMDSIVDEVEEDEPSEHGRFVMEDTSLPSTYEVPQQLENRLTENEFQFYNDAYDTSSSDIPEEIEEALSESCFSCTDEERVEKTDVVVICGEERRRSSNPDSFSIVCEDNQKVLAEQTKETETKQILSIEEPLSGDKDPFIFSQHEDLNIKTEQISMGDHETIQIERTKDSAVYDLTNALRENIEETDDRAIEPLEQSFAAKEPCPVLLTSPVSSAEEGSDGNNKPSNEPRISFRSDGSEEMYNDDEIIDHIVPLEAVAISTESESLAKKDLKTCSPSSPCDSRGYDSRVTGQHYSKEDDFINEFDDLLDEVEHALELEEKGDLTTKAATGPCSLKSPTVYYVAGEPVDKDETKSVSEGNCSYSDDKPDPIRSSNPVTRQTSPLTRKTSDRFTPFGFQPFIRSPEMTTGNPRSEDMDSIIDEVEYNEHNEHGLLEMEQTALPSNYGEVPQPLEDRLTENEIKSYNDAYDTTSSDIPEEIEEALSESCVSCTDEERVENRDTVVICGEESRRSSNPDSFSIVCEESSAQSRNQKLLVEQTKQTETRPILSIEEPLSGDNDPFIFSQHEDVNIQTEQISMRDHETMKIERSKDNVVYEEKDDRAIEPMQQSFTAKEPWPIVLTSPISSAKESISGDKPSNEPRISFHSDGSEKMYNDDEIIDHILPLEAVAMSTESESLVNKGLKTCLPSSPCDSRGYDSRGTGHHYSKEDDFINEFDDLLDEVEDALELEEKCDLTTKAATGPCSLKSPTEYCVAGGPGDKDETKSQSEGSCNYSDDKPDPIRSSNPVTRQTSPLTRKTSGRFTPFGFQPFIPSPEMTTGNPRSEDMGSIIDEVEYNEHSEHGRLEMEDTSLSSNYWEVPRQLEDRLTENEIKSYNDANDTTSSDIPEEIEEALSESCFSCTDEERVENRDMVVICGEESRRSSNPDSFSIVCEESSAQSRNQKLLVEQTKQTETRPILSIKEPLSGDKDPFIFSQHEDVNIQTEQISMGDHETVEMERSKDNVVYEEKDDRSIEPMQQSFTAKEPWPILLTSPISSAEESSDGDNKPSNEPRTSVLSDGSEKMHNDDDHVLPSEAATMSTKSESLVNRDLKTCSPSSPHDSRGYDSRVTGQHYSKEDDVINEFDDLLDEVEEAKELEEKGDLTAKAAIGPSSSKSPRKAGNLPLALLEIDENEGPTSHLTTRAFCEHYGVNKGKESTETVMELNNIRDTDAPIANKNVQGESSSVERDKMVIKGITDSVETGENSNSILQPSKTEGCTLDTLNDEKCEENSDPRSAADAMNELDSWGSFSDLLPSDNTNDKKNLPSANDVYDARTKESTEQRTGPREDSRASRELLFSHEDVQQYYSIPLVVTPVRTTVVEDPKAQRPRSSSPSPSSFESIEENDLDIKSHAVPAATNKDTEPDSLCDLGSPGLGEVKDEFLSASQEMFSPQKEDESVVVGEERKEKAKESDSKKKNNTTPSHREADCGGTIFPFASRRDQATEVSSKVNKPSKRDGKLPNSKQRILPGLENEKKPKPDEDEFIDDFDRFLDEVEEDIRTEESRSHISPSDHNKNTEKNGDKSSAFAEDETLDESVPSLSNVGSEDSFFLCDVEVADINDDDVLEAVSKKDEDPDSCDALDDKVNRQLQIHNSFSGVDRHMSRNSPSPSSVESIEENVLDIESHAATATTKKDTELDSLYNLGSPCLGEVKNEFLSASQESFSPQKEDKSVVVGEECKENPRCEEPSSHINDDESSAFAEDETLDESVPSLSNVGSGDSLFLCDVEVADINDDDVLEAVFEKDEDPDSYDTLEDKVHRQLQIRNSFSGVDRHMGQRSRSQYERSVAAVCEEHDNESSSFVKDRSLDESITSVTDIVSEESLMSSCDEEVAALFDGALEVTSDNNEDPDSWDALDVLVKKRFRNRNFYFEEDTLLDEVKRTKYERSIAAVVNISEYFFQQELLGALEAAIPDNNEEYILGESCTNEMSAETKNDLAEDDAVTQVNREERKRVGLSQRSTDVVEHRGAIRKAIEELNNIHVKLTDVGEQLLGRTGTNVRRLAAQMEIDPGTVLLDSIRLLDTTLGDVVEDFKQAIQKTNEVSKIHKENIETELALLKKENAKMLEDNEKESTKLVAQISAIQEELEMSQKRKETLQAELDANKVELKRLQSREEYKERELANLKSDFERKERKWEEADELVEKAVAERQELWDDVEYLEESLRNSRESNEHLNDRVDELKETMKELKRRRGYGHLREEVELLKGSLELCNHRETLLRCQVDTLKAETSHFRNAEQTSKSNMEILKDEKSTIIEQLEDQLAKAKMENARMVTELSQLSEKDKVLSELKEQDVRVDSQLKGQLVKLKRENSTLISEKEDQLGKVNDETSRVINRLKDEVAKLRKETSTLTKELSKTSVENEKLSRANGQTSKIMRQFEDELARLRKEHSILKTELPNVSQQDNRWNELKGEIFSVVSQLESELARLQKETSTLTMKLLKESEKDNQLHELKCETSRTISQLEDELDKIRRENSTLIKELSKAPGKDNQLQKLRGETSRIIRKLEDEVARLRKENSTMTTELSKVPEKDNQLTVLWEQVDNLRNHNKVLKDELQEAKNRLAKDLETSRDDTCDLTHDNMRSRRSHNGKSSDIKILKKRVRQTEKELEMLGRFIRQRGLDFGERLPKDVYQGAPSTGDEMVNVLDTLNHERERERDQDNKRKMQEMEGMIEDLRHTLRQTESDLEQTKGTLTLKAERTEILEHRLEENEEILEMTSQRLKQNEQNLEQTEATLRGQKERTEELENQLRSLENVRMAAEASVTSKENELEEAYCSISKQDEKINNLIQEIKQERFDKECFKRTIEVYECNVAREKGLSEKIRELEDQLQRMEDLRKTTLSSLMDKEQEVEQLYHNISRKEEQVDGLVLELKEERLNKECLKRAIEVTDCREKELKKRIAQLEIQLRERDELREATIMSLNKNERSLQDAHAEIDVLTQQLERVKSDKEPLRMVVDVAEYNATKEKGLTERIGQLEKQLQEVNELREKTLMSLKNKEWSLEEAHFKVNDLTRQIERERSDKEYLRKAVEVTECNAKREKRLLQRTEELENKLREMIELQETAQASLVTKEQELEEMYCGLRRKDNKIKDISQELQKEKSEKQGLRKAMEIAQQQRELLDEKENEVDKLKELLYDYEEKVESLNANLKQLRREVEIAEELLAYRQSDDGNLVVTSRLQHNRLHLAQKTTKRNTQENFREMGSLMAHVGNRLKNLIQRQREVYTAGMLLKQKDAVAGRVLDRLREELNQREDDMENLRNSLQKSVNECMCMRSQLEGIQCENADLKRRLGDKDDKARTLQITIKQLEGDLQRTQNFLKEREAGLEETNGTLQLKCSLLTSMEAKLCLRGNEIDELRLANKEKGLELVRVETSLREVKKELEIATSIIAKQNEQFANLKTCALRKTRDAEELKSCIQPTQDELKRLSTRLECAKNEKANLSREVVAATVRLENEKFLADRQQKALQEQVNSGLKNLKTKTKLVWDMKMDLQEAAARISRLEDEKAEQEEYFTDFKGKVSRELDLLKRTRSSENEKESLLQLTIGSAGREMATLTRENQRFRIELLQNGVGNKSSPLPREVRLSVFFFFVLHTCKLSARCESE